MTPIPPDVAAAIVAAGHSLSAEPYSPDGYAPRWQWGRETRAPKWNVGVGESSSYQAVRGTAVSTSPRGALLDALGHLADIRDAEAKSALTSARRCRYVETKAAGARSAEVAAKRAADVRTLAATVAAMWPEVTP